MMDPEKQSDQDIYNEYDEKKKEQEQQMEKWEQLNMELEELKNQL